MGFSPPRTAKSVTIGSELQYLTVPYIIIYLK